MRIETVAYDHPDAKQLIDALQQEYVIRYGEEDLTPVDPDEFRPPYGLFLLGYVDARSVGSGGCWIRKRWRRRTQADVHRTLGAR